MLEKEAAGELMRAFGKALRAQPNWKSYILSSLETFESCFGRRADKRRRLYNGMIPCQLYMYLK
jgi:putative N6-adenine-specific DNA methylase